MKFLRALLLLPALLFCYFPAIVYGDNADFFETSFFRISLFLLPAFLASVLLLWLPSLMLNEKWKKRYAILLTSIAIVGWFTGIFLSSHMGLLDGQMLREDPIGYQRWELVLTIVALAALVAIGWKWPRIHQNAALFMLLVVAGLFLITLFKGNRPYSYQKSSEPLLRASFNKNVFVFIFDTFQSDVFEDIVRDHPSLSEDLDGFTFFRNTASVAPTTYLSMPAIHSGAIYTANESMADYYEKGVRQDSFLAHLASAGYETSMINSVGPCPKGATCADLGSAMGNVWKPVLRDTALLVDISLYRFVPSFLKSPVYNRGKWVITDAVNVHRIFPNIAFLRGLMDRLSPPTSRPVARFIHLYITHPPAQVNESCEWIEPQKWKWNAVKAQSTCAVNLFVSFLQQLKEKQLYDRSLIVLMSDHGAGVSKSPQLKLLGRASALLMIKPLEARGHLKQSDSLTHVGDLSNTICQLTGDCESNQGRSTFANAELGRQVPFLEYRWKHEYWKAKRVPIEARWSIAGSPRDLFSWYKQISVPAMSPLHLDFSKADPLEEFGFGWSAPKNRNGIDFRLADSIAQVYLPLKQKQNSRIDVKISSHNADGNPSIALYVDDLLLDQMPVPTGWDVVHFDLPAAMIAHSITRLTFQSKSRSPVAFDTLDVIGSAND